MKTRYIVGFIFVICMLSISAVNAGFLDGLFGGNSNSPNSNTNNVPMQTIEIDGLFKISAPSGSKFVDDGQTSYGPSYRNDGERASEVRYIVFAPYEFNTLTPSQNQLYEQNGNITVYRDNMNMNLFYVDRHVNGCTVSLMGTNLDLLKQMANSVEIL